MNKNYTFKEHENIVRHVGNVYKKSKIRCEINSHNQNNNTYLNDMHLIYTVDCFLNHCSKDTKCIILNDYLKNSEPYWYLDYYAKSTYYRLRKKAVTEFINCMDL